MKTKYIGILLGLILGTQASASEHTITGAGATFPYPLYSKWADSYDKQASVTLNYQPIGSGGGIKQIQAGTVDFGASDKPLSVDELEKDHLTQFPTVLGGVVPVVNIPDIKTAELKLSGPVLADIYAGKIKKWTDAKITRLNPDVKLPDTTITVVHRSDGSGTTFLFTNYLSKVSDDWKNKTGSDTAVSWPTGIGGKGNEGVASYVERVKGSIGYVEYAYAQQNKLSYVQMINKAGKPVTPSIETFRNASVNVHWKAASQFNEVLTDAPGTNSWPITGATFILMQRTQQNAEKAKVVLKFFDWAYHDGKDMATQMDYVSLPDALVQQIQNHWKDQIKDKSGKAVYN